MKYKIHDLRPCTFHKDCAGHFDILDENDRLLTLCPLPIERLEEGQQLVHACNCFEELLASAVVLADDDFGDACCENSHMPTINHHELECPRLAAWERLHAAIAKTKEKL